MLEIIPDLAQWGALAVLASAFLYLLHWLMGRFDRTLRHNSNAILANTSAVLTLQQLLMMHDLTVTGINPSTGADADERSRKAFVKYQDVEKKIDELKRTIEAAVNQRH